MKQHPLPQNITSYQFHLIGSMTLKQFLFLGGGIGGAWLIFSFPLISILKWPLMGLSALAGIMFAFVPYQERPLDQWLTSFMKTIYSPTRFVWKKNPQTPIFLESTNHKPKTKTPTTEATTKTSKPITTYIRSLSPQAPQSPMDTKQQQALKNITNLFQTTTPSEPPTQTPPTNQPLSKKSVKITVRKLKTPPPDYSKPSKSNDSIEDTKPTTIPQKPRPQPQTKQNTQQPSLPSQPKKLPPQKSVVATVNPKLPFPSTPTQPNILVGMTLDADRNILESTIIEIRDSTGHPVRALKSNRLGQFYIATPLANGRYEIETEKDGYKFDIININLDNNIVQPLEIRAKSNSQPKPSLSKSPVIINPKTTNFASAN